MRRLLLAAALLATPSLARADGLPGTAGYPLWGCTLTGFCFTSQIVVGTYSNDEPMYIAVTNCTQSPTGEPCGRIIDRRVYFYDAHGELIFTYGSSTATIIEDLRQPVFGVLEVTPTLDGLAGAAAPREMILLTTPEPASMVLLGSGLVGLLAAGRRRRKLSDDAV